MAPVVDLERLVPVFSGLNIGQPVALTQLEGGSALEPDIADLHRQMGSLLRKMHQVSLPAFGRFDARGIVDPLGFNTEFILRL